MSDQLPGPSDSSVEQGFNPTGADMSGLASPFDYPGGLHMPGDAPGYIIGEDMRGMASPDAIPQGGSMGAVGNDGVPDHDGDLASSAGFHMVGSVGDSQVMQDVTEVFRALESDSGSHGSSDGGPVRGYDSMRGLVLGEHPAPAGEQDIR